MRVDDLLDENETHYFIRYNIDKGYFPQRKRILSTNKKPLSDSEIVIIRLCDFIAGKLR